jgi:iron complex outermembrane receptor protein
VGETQYVQDGFTVVNAAFKFSPDSDAWSIGLWARNLFDKHYQAAVIGQPFAPPGGVVNWNTRDARRSVGLTAAFKF